MKGGELEASYLRGDWQFGAAISVVDGVDQDDQILNSLPNDRAVLSTSWHASESWKIGARSILSKGRDKPDGSRRVGYGVHDIYAIWAPAGGALEGIRVNLGVDNLTGRDYTPATYQTGPAPGRNYKILLSRHF
ncbi:TonB-dependent receptor [Paracoccus sediminicola]|uniref:TonB-dependent receptor n=1 Tax=Paracoccus sediminicola TaxID=3017783 RepID=UPI0022F11B07|nr:TonB-dependent receptor [Paracoccus sediminicola]WBU56180.1 TonB-dependent receptor [Paracoccus sediminicola]